MRSRRRTIWTAVLVAVLAGLFAVGCDTTFLLGIDAEQGIIGLVLLGPTCPVQTSDPSCEDRPYSGWLTVTHSSGQKVTRIQSNAEGRFRVGLRPGRYVVTPDSGDPFPRGEPEDVEVVAGTFSPVTLRLDSGIR
jgi:hypothetical protein